MNGRYAPSPTGPLHVGNLRTALLAWLFARHASSRFALRVEDLDAVASRAEHERSHVANLAALGIDWDGPIVRQSERRDAHDAALAQLDAAGLLYPCFCTRREIAEAAAAPHADAAAADGAYPGTCRDLTELECREHERAGRAPALRVRAGAPLVAFDDRLTGRHERVVDDFVVRKGDGTPAYQLAVVVDDAAQGVEEVVRGDDLLDTTPRQVWLARALRVPVPAYAHVPLVLGPDGERLAKRHGSVTLAELSAAGVTADEVRAELVASLGLAPVSERVSPHELVARFDPDAIPTGPWVFDPRR